MRASMSCSRMTQSYCSDSTSGTASRRGIGVTRFTQWPASHGVSTGRAAIGRCGEPRLHRVAVHHLAVAVDVGTADVERPVHLGRHLGGAEQVVQHVAHRDRLDAAAHPPRRGHVRQHLGEVPDHLERRRARPDDDARLQHDRRHAGVEQDPADLHAGAEVRRQPAGRGMQPAEVHDPTDAVLARRGGDVARDRELGRLESPFPPIECTR